MNLLSKQIDTMVQSLSPTQYSVGLATSDEIPCVLKLRHDVFYREMGASEEVSLVPGIDLDVYDAFCDHIVVKNGTSVVGTYRVLPVGRLTGMPLGLYTTSEFDLTALQNHYGNRIVELGRSCVHSEHRNGRVPRLLWMALADYAKRLEAEAMIGCVSIHGFSQLQAAQLCYTMQTLGLWDHRFDATVSEKYRLDPGIETQLGERAVLTANDFWMTIPPLMRGYFNIGARCAGGPAWDRQFGVFDFLMILEVDKIPQKYLSSLSAARVRSHTDS